MPSARDQGFPSAQVVIVKGCIGSRQMLLLRSNPSINVLYVQLLYLQAEREKTCPTSGPHWLGLLPLSLLAAFTAARHLRPSLSQEPLQLVPFEQAESISQGAFGQLRMLGM